MADEADLVHDQCALALVRRVAAMLDQDPERLRDGDPLPRGWHIALFTVPTRQSELRPDGVGGLGARLPDLGLPRIMAGGKRTEFRGDIPIGAPVRRVSRLVSVTPKKGRSGPFTIVTVRHDISVESGSSPAIVEEQDYVMRPAASEASGPQVAAGAARPPRLAAIRRSFTPDEPLLFRYSAITFNAHRIHYDRAYATAAEGYPGLVVNGGIPVLFLIELFRREAGREPQRIVSRNVAPLFSGAPVMLCAEAADPWRLWAEDADGRIATEVEIG